jgi:hypothetical protein
MGSSVGTAEEISILRFDPIEEWLLHSHPNPERKGCEPAEKRAEILQQMADRSLPITHPAHEHIWSCSPCYSEFAFLRNQRRAAEHAAGQMRRTKWLRFGVAAASLLLVGIWFGVILHKKKEITSKVAPTAPPQIVSMVLHLRDVGTSRGSDPNRLEQVELPRRLLRLTIELPRFSSSGLYTVGLLFSKESNSAMALAAAPSVRGKDGLDTTVILDLRQVPPGPYFLGTRRDNYSALYYPVIVKP